MLLNIFYIWRKAQTRYNKICWYILFTLKCFILIINFTVFPFHSFSEEEDQLIIKVDKCDAIRNKLSVLSLILNRTRLQLYRKIEVLRNQHKECKSELNYINTKKFILRVLVNKKYFYISLEVIWDDQKRQELFTNILLETNTEHWKHLKSLTITKDIWIKIAKNLGEDFTYEKVRYQWNYIYTMLFCEKPILTSTLKLTTLDL